MTTPKPEEARKKTFEETLQRLETLVAEMEKGELGLDKMLSRFEEGMKLAEQCEKRLGETRKRVEILLKKSEDAAPRWEEVQQEPDPPDDSNTPG